MRDSRKRRMEGFLSVLRERDKEGSLRISREHHKGGALNVPREQRMRRNLVGGVCWLLLGLAVICLVECLWDARAQQLDDTALAYEAADASVAASTGASVEENAGTLLATGADTSADASAGADASSTTNTAALEDSENMMAFVLGNEAVLTNDGVPEAFKEECFGPNEWGDVYCSQEERVIGIVSEDATSELFARCSERLVTRGWTRVNAGADNCASFLKEEGELRWLFMQTFDAGGSSLAVISYKGE